MPSLHSAETLLIEGPDAMAFAHAQFSSSVDSLPIGQWQFSAWLDSQGRVRTLFQLARIDSERYLLLLRGGIAADMVEALRRFVFRARVTLTALPSRNLCTGPALPLHAIVNDDETIALGCGTHSMKITHAGASDDAWRLPQLRSGWPWLPASALNTLLPAALSLQRLQAVAVDKGCYPGQEIVARLHFRGGHKRHLHRGRLSQALHAGDMLHIGKDEAGCVLDAVTSDDGNETLLILKDDLVQDAIPGNTIVVGDQLALQLEASWPA
ncbi:MAG TPA: folate-binding protein [Rhodanobacter sp.]|nr:folate-binding protein [Rhodanobacter sp.]